MWHPCTGTGILCFLREEATRRAVKIFKESNKEEFTEVVVIFKNVKQVLLSFFHQDELIQYCLGDPSLKALL